MTRAHGVRGDAQPPGHGTVGQSPATRRRGDDDGDHMEQFFAEDGSSAKVTAKPGTPARTTVTGRSRMWAATELLTMRAACWSIAPAIDRAESAIWRHAASES